MRVLIFLEVALLKKLANYFTKTELLLWSLSVALIAASFCLFDRENYLTLSASLIGVTSLIFNAKGNPFGQVLMILFSLLYGVISYAFSYFGEMLTYWGMTLPMAVFALVSWLKNPYNGNKSEVSVNTISKREMIVMSFCALAVTLMFYFVLVKFNTANIVPSTVSVTTSFLAVYLTFRRSPFFCAGLRGKRRRFNCLMGFSKLDGYSLSFRRRLFFRFLRQ